MTNPSPDLAVIDGIPRVSSLAIADHFQKRHEQVLRKIRQTALECPSEFNEHNFVLVEYVDEKGESRPMYQLSRDGFTLLAMGFAGKKALAWKIRYIEAFNAMEKALLEKSKPKALPAASLLPDVTENYRRMREDMEVVLRILKVLIPNMQFYGPMSGFVSQMEILQHVSANVTRSLADMCSAQAHLKEANRFALMLK